jgi:hypothetical protein
MRFMYKRDIDEDLQADLEIVQDTLNSGYFILIDLLFWAFFLTIFTTTAHHSIKLALIFFISYYISGVGLFLLLRSWFKD